MDQDHLQDESSAMEHHYVTSEKQLPDLFKPWPGSGTPDPGEPPEPWRGQRIGKLFF
jgi:hypothetical protein